MVKWRINTLSPQEIAKYRQRSVRAINGLNYCKQNAHIIAQYEKVTDKYKTIADYMGLGQEGGNSYYNFFVPTNKNIVFLLRNANHNNLNPSLYDMHEQLGRPNKRFVIFFKNGNTFSDVPVVFQESEHHVIPYNVNALDNEPSIIAYIDALIKLFTKGKTTFPNLPIVTENKLHTNMNKRLIRLTESDLHRIVKESVDKILAEAINELDPRTYASYAQKRRQQATNANNFSDMSKYSTKADAGENAARNAWNNKYGEDEMFPNGYNQTEMINTSQNPYQVHHQSFTQNNRWDDPRSIVNNQARTFDGNRVAKQMQQGNGQYIKGKGWQ